MTRLFTRVAVALAMVIGLLGVVAAPAAAASDPGAHRTPALEVSINVLGCNPAGGGDVDFVLQNNRTFEIWYTISVYRNHDGLVFEGDESVLPADPDTGEDGKGTLQYRGLPPAEYVLVVRSGGRVLAAAAARFRRCPALPDIPPPPPGQPLTQQLVQQ